MSNADENANLHTGHRQRLRERFRTEGLESFAVHNILELLLFYCIPRRDTNELAHRLADRFGSLSGVFDATADELAGIPGMTENAVTLMKLMPQLCREYMLDRGSRCNSLDTYEKLGVYLCDYFIASEREYTVMLPLMPDNTPRDIIVIAEGTPDSCTLEPRMIAERGLHSGASSFILAHNHLNGSAQPSAEDISVTAALTELFDRLGMPMREHFVIAGRCWERCKEKLM